MSPTLTFFGGLVVFGLLISYIRSKIWGEKK